MTTKNQIQIRWSKEDIQFLVENYKTMGNVEIAEILTKEARSWRIINGVKVVRKFNQKNVEKKMDLLGLKRTEEDLKYIIKHNREIGKGHCWTKKNNPYTMGIKSVFDDGVIREWSINGRQYKYIKVNGKFISYPRYLWEQKIGKIPSEFKVAFKDGNPDNCELSNLECISSVEMMKRNSANLNLPDGVLAFWIAGKKGEEKIRQAIKQNPQLLELKRNQILLNRKIKEKNQWKTKKKS